MRLAVSAGTHGLSVTSPASDLSKSSYSAAWSRAYWCMSLAMHSAMECACARVILLAASPPSLDYGYILASILCRFHVQNYKFGVVIFTVIFHSEIVKYHSFR